MAESYCISAEDYVSLERPDLDFLWGGMLPRPSLVVLEGAPKVGKTFLALQISKAIAEGTPFGGRPTKQARVLYLILEDEPSWHKRMLDIKKALGVPWHPNLYIPHPLKSDKPFIQNILAPDTQRWLKGCLGECDPELIVIDPIREVHSADEQDSTQMKIVGDALVSTFHGRTMLVLHHTRKYEPDPANPRPPDPVLAGRGSSYLAGKASAIWLLWRASIEDPHGVLLCVPRFALSSKYDLQQRDPGLWHWQTERVIPVENLPPDVLVCGLGGPDAAAPSPPSHPGENTPAVPLGPGVHPPGDALPHPDVALTSNSLTTPPEPHDTLAHGNHPVPHSDGKANGRAEWPVETVPSSGDTTSLQSTSDQHPTPSASPGH